MLNISIISGTDRPGSLSLQLAGFIKQKYEDETVKASIASMEDFPLTQVVGGKYGEKIADVEAFISPILQADGWVIIIPEYNGSFPGILKMFIDYLPYPGGFQDKPVAFIGEGDGAFGGLRAVEHMQMVAGYRQAYTFPQRVFVQRVRKNFDQKDGITDPLIDSLLDEQVKGFIKFIRQLSGSMDAAVKS